MNAKTTVFNNEKCWMEHTALTQLGNVAGLSGVIRAVGLLIHSGSWGYGRRILSTPLNFDGLKPDTKEGKDYLLRHDDTLLWAQRNRQIMAAKLMDHLGYSDEANFLLDCHHNFLEERNDVFVHRKGAVIALDGPVIIPVSRGSLTYTVMSAQDTQLPAHSLSHGAGRKWARSLCKSRIKNKHDRDTFNDLDSEALMLALKGVCSFSNGSACTSQEYPPSHVLQAMSLSQERIVCAVRLSWDLEDVSNCFKALIKTVDSFQH